MIFEIRNVKKLYQNRKVLDIPKLTIKEEKIYSIVGPNGAGKTTLLEILSGLNKPSSGEVFYNGKNIIKRGFGEVGIVLCTRVSFSGSIKNNLLFALHANKIPKNEFKQRISEVLNLVGLAGLHGYDAKKLSTGQKNRLVLARALILEPKVLLLDEPASSLDEAGVSQLKSIVKTIKKRFKTTIVVASHNWDFVLSISSKTFSLKDGKIVPTAMENFFSGKAENGLVTLENGLQISALSSCSGDVNLVIPPTAIVLSVEPLKSSMRNVFKGYISKLIKQGKIVEIEVDIGINITSRITLTSFQNLKLNLGSYVYLHFKATSVRCY